MSDNCDDGLKHCIISGRIDGLSEVEIVDNGALKMDGRILGRAKWNIDGPYKDNGGLAILKLEMPVWLL